MIIFWQWLNVISIIWIFIVLILYYKKNGFYLSTVRSVYVHLAITVSFSILALLAFLSITQKPCSDHYTKFWTYVQELRYYSLVLIFIPQTILLIMVFQRNLVSGINKIFIATFIFIAIVEIFNRHQPLSFE